MPTTVGPALVSCEGDGTLATLDEFRAVGRRISNWGRWGEDDQLGTLNFIDEQVQAAAARTVRAGKAFSLGILLHSDLMWPAHWFRRNPIHVMLIDGGDARSLSEFLPGYGGATERQLAELWQTPFRFAEDMIVMSLQSGTQWDALSHVWYDDLLYNGAPAAAVTSRGATTLSIDRVAVKGIASRGVLLDIARYRGMDSLPPRSPVGPHELDEVAAAQGVQVRPGDVVMVRTGWWREWSPAADSAAWRAGCPGLSWTCAEWLADHRVAAVAADNLAVEAAEAAVDGMFMPMHGLCLRDLGMMLGELWDLEELALDCADDGVYECQLVAAPMPVAGAVGSPVNPVAMK
jgi:kynurenine formamidase